MEKPTIYKVVFLGPIASGKSRLIAALREAKYHDKPTIGVDFYKMEVDDLCLQLWDTNTRSERFSPVSRLYIRSATLIVITVNTQNAVEQIQDYINNTIGWIRQENNAYDNIILVGTQVDCLKGEANQQKREQIENFFRHLQDQENLDGYFMVSALTKENIQALKEGMVDSIHRTVAVAAENTALSQREVGQSNFLSINDDDIDSLQAEQPAGSHRCVLM